MKLSIDFETRSACDLEQCGAWRYSEDPTTQAMCVAMSVNGQEPEVFDLMDGAPVPDVWWQAVQLGWSIHAFNAFFEYSILHNVLKHWPQPNLENWHDTQAKSCAMGFPASLAIAAQAAGLTEKDSEGERLIRWFSFPIAAGGKKGQFRDPALFPDEWEAFKRYCQQDVRVEMALDAYCADLSEDERAFWLATWDMNTTGVGVDMALVRGLKHMTYTGRELVGATVSTATDGYLSDDVASNHRKVANYVQMKSVAKKAVKEALAGELTPVNRIVLEARQVLGKSSVSKLNKLEDQVGSDGRLRDIIRYHGAGTGRDTGKGAQLQNIPRGAKLPVNELVEAATSANTQAFLDLCDVKQGDRTIFDPMSAVSTCLRACLVATDDKTFLQCDYAAIEPRVNAWLSGQNDMLETFRKYDADPKTNPDIYQKFAAGFYNKDPLSIQGDERQYGKVAELQLGYGAGAENFQTAAKDQYGLVFDLATALEGVNLYRSTHEAIMASHMNYESAARLAISRPKKAYAAGRITFYHDGTHLWTRLPSGRKLCYPFANVALRDTKFGKRHVIVYMCYEKGQWLETHTYGGALCENFCQAVASCLLRAAVIRLRANGFRIVLRVHDELVAEDYEDRFSQFKNLMLAVPEWAEGLPVAGGGWVNPRYKK